MFITLNSLIGLELKLVSRHGAVLKLLLCIVVCCCILLLGQLLRVIKWVSNVRPYVRMSVRPQKVGTGWWVMHDGLQYDPIQGQSHDPLKVGNSALFKGYLLPHLQWGWQMTTHSQIRAQYLKPFGAGFLIFGPVFVSCDFEVGRNVTCEESTVSPIRS